MTGAGVIEEIERTTPLRQPFRRPLRRGRAQLGRRERGGHAPDQVVRVRFPGYRRTYAYLCRGPISRGALVEVDSPYSGTVVVPVVGFGRRGWQGPLKRARPVR